MRHSVTNYNSIMSLMQNLRKWDAEFFDLERLSLPRTQHIPHRLGTNLEYFISNYCLAFLLLLAASLAFHLTLLLILVVFSLVYATLGLASDNQ